MRQMSSPLLSVRDEAAMLCPHAYGDIADRVAGIPGFLACARESDRVEMGGWQRRYSLLRYTRGRGNESRDQHRQSRFATAASGNPGFVRHTPRQYRSQLSQFRDLETSQRSEFCQYRRPGHGQRSNRSCAAARPSVVADVRRSSGGRISPQHVAVRPQGRATRHPCSGCEDSGRSRYTVAGNGTCHFLRATGIDCQATRWPSTSTATETAFLTLSRCNVSTRFPEGFSLCKRSRASPRTLELLSADSSSLNRCRVRS